MVNKSGAGTLTLSGDNTGYTNGGTVLNIDGGGTVSIGDSNDMMTGGIVMDAGTLKTTGVATLANPITLNAGGGTFNTGGDLTLNGNITGAGGLRRRARRG